LGAGGRPIKQAAAEGPADSTPLSEATVQPTLSTPIFGSVVLPPGSDAPHIHPHELTRQVLGKHSDGETAAELAHHPGAVFLRKRRLGTRHGRSASRRVCRRPFV